MRLQHRVPAQFVPVDSTVKVNRAEIREVDGRFDATVTLANGFTESIEGLYDWDSAHAWTMMHFSYHDNRYV